MIINQGFYTFNGSFINLFKNFDKYDFMYASQNETYLSMYY